MAASQVLVGPVRAADEQIVTQRGGKDAEGMVSELNARYYELAYRGRLFTTTAFVTANVIFSTAAGTGGPLIWNPPGSGINVVLLKVGWAVTVTTTITAAIGITGGSGQLLAPTAATAIDVAQKTTLVGSNFTSLAQAYEIGTVLNAGALFMAYGNVSTAAVTVQNPNPTWVDFEGSIIAPPGSWLSAGSCSKTLSSLAILHVSAMWAEVPI